MATKEPLRATKKVVSRDDVPTGGYIAFGEVAKESIFGVWNELLDEHFMYPENIEMREDRTYEIQYRGYTFHGCRIRMFFDHWRVIGCEGFYALL